MIWLFKRKRRGDDGLYFHMKVHLGYRVVALAELITIVTARNAVITSFSAKGAGHALGLGNRMLTWS